AKIQAFTTDGEFLAAWQTPDHGLGRPSGLAFDPNGNLLVADSHYHQILVYTPKGQLVGVFGGESGRWPLTGEFGYVGDVAIDSKGFIFVAESQQHERITKLSPDYQIVKRWGGRGNEPGNFMRIRSMC